jgi:hypothetical protein
MMESNRNGDGTGKITTMSDDGGVQPPSNSRGSEKTKTADKSLYANGKLNTGCSDGTKNAHLFHFSGILVVNL